MNNLCVDFLLSGLHDTSGNPLNGGLVYTYIAGTTTPLATFLDQDLTIPAENPIVLDTNGQAQIYANGLYKFVVTDSNGEVINTWDELGFFPPTLLNWRGAWTSGDNYDYYDLVSYSTGVYICIVAITDSTTIPSSDSTHFALMLSGGTGTQGPAGQGFNWRGAWVSGHNYAAYDVVEDSTGVYNCILAITNSTTLPESDTSHFALMILSGQGTPGEPGLVWKGTYSGSVTYLANDVVYYEGSSYVCIATTTGNLPTNPSFWNLLVQAGTSGTQGLVWRGAYSGSTAYAQNDAVSYDGSSYICIEATTGNLPTNGTYWNLLVAVGQAGDQGVPGLVWKGVYSGSTAYSIGDAVYYQGSSYICILSSTGNLPTNGTYWDLLAEVGQGGIVWLGPYNGSTAYVIGNAVSYNGSSYICILASTGNLPTDGTHWNLLVESGVNGTNGIAGLQWQGVYNAAVVYVVNDAVSYLGSSYICIQNTTGHDPTNQTYWDMLVEEGQAGLVWRGAYNGSTAYADGDAVSYSGSSYICIVPTTGNLPTNGTYWNLLVEVGAAGEQGIPGLVWRGAYSGGTTYAPGDAVIYQGSSYICILASTGNVPTNQTYWDLLAEVGQGGIVWRGAYDNGTAYSIGNAVSYNGSSYICILASTGNIPTDGTYWNLLVEAGTNGENGIAGLNWKGAYNAGTAYAIGDAVSYNGSSYIAIAATTGNSPSNPTYWDILAEVGQAGLVWRGAYSSSINYVPGNAVSYQGSSYICILQSINNVPTNGTYWNLLVEVGQNGQNGIAGLNWKGAYNGSTAYAVNDAVSYQGSSYICILTSTGNVPTNGTYWDLIAEIGQGGLIWLGTYNNLTPYVPNDAVSYNGSSFVCIADTTGNLPTNGTYWDLLVEAGTNGSNGINGVVWQGVYSGSQTYHVNDAVSYQGSSYICIATTTGNLPTNGSFWDLLVEVGQAGANGADFISGTAGGTSDALTVSIPGFPLVNTLSVQIFTSYSNTTPTPTLAYNSGTPYPIVRPGGFVLMVGDIQASSAMFLVYDSNHHYWVLLNPAQLNCLLTSGTNYTIGSAATQVNGTSTTPVLARQWTMTQVGQVQVSFRLGYPYNPWVRMYAQLYLNGVPYGSSYYLENLGLFHDYFDIVIPSVSVSVGTLVQIYFWGTDAVVAISNALIQSGIMALAAPVPAAAVVNV